MAVGFVAIPKLLEERLIKRYSRITGPIQTGYFTFQPREDETGFERDDKAHQEVLRWVENCVGPVLYLTGASGTGKSSLLSSWVIPKLRRANHRVIRLRAHKQDLLRQIRDELLRPGFIWNSPPADIEDLRFLLSDSIRRFNQSDNNRRLFIIIDQFEEFLILADSQQHNTLWNLLSAQPIPGLSFILTYRLEFHGLLEDQKWPALLLDSNRKIIQPFTPQAANGFMRRSGFTFDPVLLQAVLSEAAAIDKTKESIRPITLNLCGILLSRVSNGKSPRFSSGFVRDFLRDSLNLPGVREVANKIIPHLISENLTRQQRSIADLVIATRLAPEVVVAFLRRLGEGDCGILCRREEEEKEVWAISHDFWVPLLDAFLVQSKLSWSRRLRPWLPLMFIAGLFLYDPQLYRGSRSIEIKGVEWLCVQTPEGWKVHSELNVTRERQKSLLSMQGRLIVELSGSQVTDILLLDKLQSLSHLTLRDTKVSDLSPLSELNGLTSLELINTPAINLSPLKKLGSLTSLVLFDTELTDLSPLKDLQKIRSLSISGWPLTQSTTRFMIRKPHSFFLEERANATTDLSPLQFLTGLTALELHGDKVTDLSPLKDLKGLISIDLSFTGVTDLSPLKNLINLRTLNLSQTKATDLRPLKNLKNLTIVR